MIFGNTHVKKMVSFFRDFNHGFENLMEFNS